MARELIERTVEIDGIPTFVRSREGKGPPAVFVHGNPTDSDDWLPFMERLEGPSLAFDLPGFGRSGRPREFPCTMDAYAKFFTGALERLGVGEHSLVVHDWGALALAPATARAERVRRLVVLNSVPLLPGYRWHWVARIWRRRGLGELFNAAVTRPTLALTMRQARGDRSAMPDEYVDRIMRNFDSGMKRAILALYRSADPERLAEAGAGLDRLACPSLVVWGGRDPYLGAEWGRAYVERLPRATLVELPRAGHWPWIDDPSVIDRVVRFLAD